MWTSVRAFLKVFSPQTYQFFKGVWNENWNGEAII